MKALILAAGTGSRLRPLTDDKPKTLLKIEGVPIIHYLVHGLLSNGIDDICIVTGHQHQALIDYVLKAFPGHPFSFVYNPHYKKMNNIYSYFLAAPYCFDGPMMSLNSDVFCEPDLIREMIYAPWDSMLVDGDKDYSQEATKVIIDDHGMVKQVSKEIPPEQSDGEYTGIIKLSGSSCRRLHKRVKELLYAGMTGLWFIYALNDILQHIPTRAIPTRGRIWEEIDTFDDYHRSLRLAENLRTS